MSTEHEFPALEVPRRMEKPGGNAFTFALLVAIGVGIGNYLGRAWFGLW